MLFFGNDLAVCVDRCSDGEALQEKPLRTKKKNRNIMVKLNFIIRS